MTQLSSKDYLQIVKIKDWDWIPELKIYGPVGKRMVRVDDIINMLNRGLFVQMSKENMQKLYLFIKEYNLVLKNTKEFSHLTQATTAEASLEELLYKDVYTQELQERQNNPLDDAISDAEALEIAQIDSDAEQRVLLPKRISTKKIKKVKHYELFKDTKVTSGPPPDYNNIELDN